MQSISILIRALASLLLTATSQSILQGQNPAFLNIVYTKTEPGKAADHRKFLENEAKRLHQAYVGSGYKGCWFALRLTNPYSVNEVAYNYILGFCQNQRPVISHEDPAMAEVLAQKAGFQNRAEYVARRDAVERTVRQEVRTVSASSGQLLPGSFIRSERFIAGPEHREELLHVLNTYFSLSVSPVSSETFQAVIHLRPDAFFYSDEQAGFTQEIWTVGKAGESFANWPSPKDPISSGHGKNNAAFLAELTRAQAYARREIRLYEVVAFEGTFPTIQP